MEQVKADTGRAMTDILDMILNARNEQCHEQEHRQIIKETKEYVDFKSIT